MRFCSVGSPPFCTSSGEAPKLAKTFFFTAKFHSVHSEHPTSAPLPKNTLRADRSTSPLHVGIGRRPAFDEKGDQSETGNSLLQVLCVRASSDTNVSATPSYNRFGSSSEASWRHSQHDLALHDRVFSRLPATGGRGVSGGLNEAIAGPLFSSGDRHMGFGFHSRRKQ